jgi:hypothetical protein
MEVRTGGEEVKAQLCGEELGDQLALDAVAGLV